MSRLAETASALIMAELLAATPAKAEEPTAAHSLEEIANDYYGTKLRSEVLGVLCTYSKTYGANMTPDCKNLPKGAEVVFPENREFSYLTCEVKPEPALCRFVHSYLTEKERAESVFTALDKEHQTCVEKLREYNPTAELGMLVVSSRMIRGNSSKNENWTSTCENLDLKTSGFLSTVTKDNAVLTGEGWVVTEHLR